MPNRITAIVFTVAGLLSAAGCSLIDLDGDDDRLHIRGYTSCGDFAGDDAVCQPGQFCADEMWSECEIGCLSDVNCASNQICILTRPREAGYCENIRSVSSRLSEAPDAGNFSDVIELQR
jgi:hypothetical protein